MTSHAPGRREVTAFVGASTFMLTFALFPHLRIPRLWYHPIEHTWTFEVNAAGIAMGFYGRVLFALVTMSLGGLLARVAWRVLCLPVAKRVQFAAFLTILVTTTTYVLASDLAWIDR